MLRERERERESVCVGRNLSTGELAVAWSRAIFELYNAMIELNSETLRRVLKSDI